MANKVGVSDKHHLLRAILTNPEEDTPKLALADWFDENDDSATAHAVRWCVVRKKWPHQMSRSSKVTWHGSGFSVARHCLPRLVYGLIKGRSWKATFPNTERALESLGKALAKLKGLYEPDGGVT
jgi:uncharacterized protein (TIGR02996 family)